MKKNQKVGCAFFTGGCLAMCGLVVLVVVFFAFGASNVKLDQKPSSQFEAGYSYREIYKLPGVKRTLDVYLSAEAPESRLREIAEELKSKEDQPYSETLIGFYLPGMDTEHAAWATAHFKPDLKININPIMAHPDLKQ